MQYIPLLVLAVSLVLMVYCLVDLSKRTGRLSLSKTVWAVLIVLGSLFGQVAYLILEVRPFRKGRV
jgi:steroid 5-alpha reductase family enzyme